MAFASYAVQILGLNGSNGILPTADLLAQAGEQLGVERYWLFPTVAWFNGSDAFLQGITYAGTFLSFLMILGIATGPALVILTVLWLSLVTGGGEFTGFQSDGMLVEASVLSLFFVSWQWFEPPWPFSNKRQSNPSAASLWLIRFMIFRIMLASGLVKLLSGDPAWQSLTAMQYHYETQPIPTPLAWYAHQLPPWFQKLSCLGMYVSEMVAPILIFAGRRGRIAAAFLISSLHFFINLTGNYTFLSYLMIALCIPLIDDGIFQHLLPRKLTRAILGLERTPFPPRWHRLLINSAASILLFLAASQFVMTVLGGKYLPDFVEEAMFVLAPFHIVDRYGLFAVMTTRRPEIVFQGSEDGKNWISYEFKYKPGDDLTRPPPWVAPHMPRLDWRLWFAAMEPVQSSPWVIGLVRRLLEGSKDVNIFFVRNPFPMTPPKYICAFVYDYHFSNFTIKNNTGNWWWRNHQQRYFPPVSLPSIREPEQL
jgi:uncharacterized membrane protein YphA (DoxX/SURF4 family)